MIISIIGQLGSAKPFSPLRNWNSFNWISFNLIKTLKFLVIYLHITMISSVILFTDGETDTLGN